MTSKTAARAALWRVCALALMALLPQLSWSASTDLATSPLETSTATLVKPNILFILDDSGSMGYAYLPDWAGNYSGTAKLYNNPKFNGIYYDPAVTYTPPVKYDGTSYASMTSANSSAWAKVPIDGFGVSSTSTTNLSGRTLADLITGERSELTELPWVGHRSRQWEPEPLRWLGINAMVRVPVGADEYEARTDKPARLRNAFLARLTGH